ncbi:hypothetical protein UFOVP566_61 [uncultured Caudovirales phage]|uniref:Uncharacterized protein n=1 Tax=uncultured Caudovirales phage TaxID=2100421 RepID=A0A6J5LT32_9CAUD|nr:hypothetical protein UFOVP294_24 [uncultured Caudovirales phage]CAB4150649.1 hypothetical protein UFOVP566_61 [uncultured Caudovirales phage]
MTTIEYVYEGATFVIEYEVDWVDSKESTHAYVTSIKHKDVEFLLILDKDLIKHFEEEVNERLFWDGIDPYIDHKYHQESHP